MKVRPLPTKLAAILAASALVFTGCASNNSGSSEANSSSKASNSSDNQAIEVKAADYNETPYDQVKDGGELVTPIAEISSQQNRNHADAPLYTLNLWRWYNPQFVLFDGEGNYSINDDYLTDVKEEIKDGNTVVTFTIRDEAKYNDGTDMDWKTFHATWKINNGESDEFKPNSTDGYDRITSVEQGETPKQAVITFRGTYPWWQSLFNEPAHPALEDPANYNDYVNKVHPEWGAGPYTVDYVDFNKGEAVFKRNDNWWGDKGKLDRRIFRQMEADASINAFKNGEVDVTSVSARDRWAAVEGMDGIEKKIGHKPKISLLTLNAKSPQLSDIKVREGIVTGIDRETLSKIWFQGLPYQETPPGSFIIHSFQPTYQDNFSKVVSYDPEKANKILDEAGWVKGSDGIREKDGQKLSLRYVLTGAEEITKNTASAFQKMMKEIGVDIKIEERPSSEFSNIYTARDFDLFPMGFTSSDPFGVAFFDQTYGSDSDLNVSSTGDAAGDAKIKELQDLPTRDEQTARSNEIEPEFLQRFGIVPMYAGPDMFAQKEGLANVGAYGFAIVKPQNIGWKK